MIKNISSDLDKQHRSADEIFRVLKFDKDMF